MSSIFGLAATRSIPQCGTILESIFRAIRPAVSVIDFRWTADDGRGGVGVVHPQNVGRPVHWAEDAANGIICVFDGIVYTDAEGHEIDTSSTSGADVLLGGYLRSGPECLSKISGNFNVAWWDARRNRLVLGSDKVGQRLLFYAIHGGKLAFSSLLAGVVAAGVVSPTVDVEGFADLIYYGQILGERTLFEDLKVLLPASILVFEAGEAKLHRYWHFDHVEQHGTYNERRLDELEALFKRAVKRCFPPQVLCSIGLTGGLDSRCVLAGAVNQGLPCIAHTGGQRNSTDVVLAKRAASRVKVRHLFEPITPQRLDEWLVPMVYRQGGIAASLHSHPCRDIWHPREYAVAVPGVAGEPVRAVWIYNPAYLDIRDPVKARQTLQQTPLLSSKVARSGHYEQIWQLSHRSVGIRAPGEHMSTILAGFAPREPPVLLWEYFLAQEHHRKMLNKGIIIVRSSREVYLPYIDHEWVEAVAAIPISERKRANIQVDLIRRLSPKLLGIPWEKDMIPLSASPWKVKWIKRIRRRLTGPPRKVPAAYYTLWSRNEMRPFLAALLYDPKAAFRTYLRWDRVEALLNAHFSGQEDWLDFVGALTVFEIAHRLWVEPRDFPLGVTPGMHQSDLSIKHLSELDPTLS